MEGTATATAALLMTDVEGSTRLWSEHPAQMNEAMARHHEIVHGVVEAHGGWRPVDQGEGDSVFAAFASARLAVVAAAAVQKALAAEQWPPPVTVRVRIGVHVGEVIRRGGNLWGDTVNKCARIRALGYGGQTLVSAAVWAQLQQAPPDGMSFFDLGEHRMKDLSRPERIHQLDVEGLPSEFPPLKSLDRARHNLPVQTTPLVGRDNDVAAIRELLDEHRLVTLVGFGGIGKTRLALEVAASFAAGDADGVWFVDLSAVSDPEFVPTMIANVLSIKESGTGAIDAVLDELSGKRLLLVLDNLEQVLGCARFIAQILEHAPDVAILATSREALRIRGEQEYPVDALHAADSVALFASRAAAVRNGFTLTPAVAATVGAICSKLDGHPLAIELAAARMKVLTAEALLARLDSALKVLTAGGRDRPERHQTLRATIEWSYDTLAPEERMLLARLSVFPGSMTFDAIEAVCGEPFGYDGIDVLDAVTALVEKSLLRALPVDDADPEPRYDMLVSVREYAAERLAASGATAEVVRRHAMFYADVNMLDSDSVEDGAAVVQRVGRELHNMRAACDWAQRAGTSEDELRFSTFLLILVDAGHFDEAKERALHALARHRAPAPGRVRMLAVLSYLYWHTAEPDKERQAIEDQLAEARELGDASLLASALLDDVQNIVDRDELLARVDEIDALISSIPPGRTEAPVWYLLELRDNRISIALRYADPDRALEFARSYYETTHFDQFVGGSLLASLYVDRGDWEAAETTLREIEKYAGVTWSGDRLNDAEATHSLLQPMWARTLALVALGRGDVAAATGYAENALRRVQPLGMQHWISRSHATLAACHAAAGRVDEARAELLSAREGYEGDNAQLGMVEWRLARVARLAGDLDEARRRVDTARALVAGQELTMLTDVLAAVLEEAHLAIDTDPEQAARLVARVARDRGSFVLPMGASEDVEPLLTALCSRLGGERLAEIVAEVAARPPWST